MKTPFLEGRRQFWNKYNLLVCVEAQSDWLVSREGVGQALAWKPVRKVFLSVCLRLTRRHGDEVAAELALSVDGGVHLGNWSLQVSPGRLMSSSWYFQKKFLKLFGKGITSCFAHRIELIGHRIYTAAVRWRFFIFIFFLNRYIISS